MFHDYWNETYVLIHFIADSPEKCGVTSTLLLPKTKFNSCSHLLQCKHTALLSYKFYNKGIFYIILLLLLFKWVPYETQHLFLSFTLSFFIRLAVLVVVLCEQHQFSERSQCLHFQGKDEGTVILQNVRNYLPIDTVSHPRRLELSFLLLILLKLPLIMMWALSYGTANISVSVFIANMQKLSSKLVQWQCITYKKRQ